jgi:hypothetical protein
MRNPKTGQRLKADLDSLFMLLVLLTYALYLQVRSALWMKKHRELSLLKFVSHFQALADSWMKMIFKSELTLRRFLQEACDDAARLAAKASRKRCTSAKFCVRA